MIRIASIQNHLLAPKFPADPRSKYSSISNLQILTREITEHQAFVKVDLDGEHALFRANYLQLVSSAFLSCFCGQDWCWNASFLASNDGYLAILAFLFLDVKFWQDTRDGKQRIGFIL